tara:strand:- start:208 stop:360 length:153 start_codon:yes stop_codon:yes gene_type:complete
MSLDRREKWRQDSKRTMTSRQAIVMGTTISEIRRASLFPGDSDDTSVAVP